MEFGRDPATHERSQSALSPSFGRVSGVKEETMTTLQGLHATLKWEPFTYVGDGYKATGYQREDGAGYVIPIFNEKEWRLTDRWWVTWAHPMLCGRPGWHHHALGTYVSAEAGAMAFDEVYELERIAGNTDRMSREDARAIEAQRATTVQQGVVHESASANGGLPKE